MSSFELVYFPITARALSSRIILTLAGANWKNRIPQWPAEKASMPFERLPVLNETSSDGYKFTLVESTAIERYLARKFGFLPSDNQVNATLEQYALQISDSFESFITYNYQNKSKESKADMEKNLVFLLKHHEPILAANPSGHYYGENISYPDIVLYSLYQQVKANNVTDIFNESDFPHIMKLISIMESNDKVSTAVSIVS
ncbi:putative glutathione S-transferase 6 [Smittium culicis]|uniref:Putative glutathione S-transferase 6 n=1 Tax=Smittium culicis TaxID=133412 RepID=A0A1R1Y9M7_9FUNG|nr:putative glutathione S-transferase 6 [Smittium culicis]